ncbi:hypothetical protein F5Y14DRAFT_435830 [Nemania sp. NC0429]|nr:hypothetical protein F5Y14DRAFT_435830 [Nemania sp. NC0429]
MTMPNQPSDAADITRPAKFTLFNRLPPELRVMIWEEFIRFPRIIPIYPCLVKPRPDLRLKIGIVTRELVPALLLVNRESRRVAMKSIVLFSYINDDMPKYVHAHHFAISRHDIVLYPNSFKWVSRWRGRLEGDSSKIANIMISVIPEDLAPVDSWCMDSHRRHRTWCGIFSAADHIIGRLGNMKSLQRFYCLFLSSRDWSAPKGQDQEPLRFDDLCELVPSQDNCDVAFGIGDSGPRIRDKFVPVAPHSQVQQWGHIFGNNRIMPDPDDNHVSVGENHDFGEEDSSSAEGDNSSAYGDSSGDE